MSNAGLEINDEDAVIQKSYDKVSALAKQYRNDSNDPLEAETSFILNSILGSGVHDMMTESGILSFLKQCEDGLHGFSPEESAVLAEASRNVHKLIFG